MTIKEFTDLLKNSTNVEMTCSKRIVKQYVPYQDKIAHCQSIITNTTKKKIGESEIYYQNTPAQYVLFVLTLINLYTDIDVDFNNILDSFNALDEFGGIDGLITAIPQKEYDQFNTLLHMTIDDQYENSRSVVGYLDSKFQTLGLLLKSVSESEEFKNLLENEEFKKFFEKQ